MDDGIDVETWRNDSLNEATWVVEGSCVDALVNKEWRRCLVVEVDMKGGVVTVMDGEETVEVPLKLVRRSQILEVGDQVIANGLLHGDAELNGLRGVVTQAEESEDGLVWAQFQAPHGLRQLHVSKLNPLKHRRESNVCLMLPPIIHEGCFSSSINTRPYGNDDRPTPNPTPRRIESGNSLTADYRPLSHRNPSRKTRFANASPAPSDMLLRSMANMTYSSFGGDLLPNPEPREQVWTPPFVEKRKKKLLRTQHLHRAMNKTRTCGHEVEDIYRDKALRRRAVLIATVSVAGVLSAVITLLTTGSVEGVPLADKVGNFVLQMIGAFLTFVAIVLICNFHYVALAYDRSHNPSVSFTGGEEGWQDHFVRGRLITLVSEVLVHLLYPFPYYLHTRWSAHLACLMFIRVYTVVRACSLCSTGYVYRFDILNQKHISSRFTEYNIGWPETLKIFLIRRTFTFFFVVTTCALLSCSFMIFIAEREAQPNSFTTMRDAVYFMFVTFSTIGYGEIVPITDLGRAVTVIAGVLGVFLANLFAAIFAVKFQPTPIETEVLRYIDKIDASKSRYIAAVRFIQLYWRDRKKALENGLWRAYVEGEVPIRSWLDIDTLRALVLSKQTRLKALDVTGDSVADRDLIATRTHTTLVKQGKEMKKLWNRLKALATILGGIKDTVRDVNKGIAKETQGARSQYTRLYELYQKSERRKSITDSQQTALLAELAESMQFMKVQGLCEKSMSIDKIDKADKTDKIDKSNTQMCSTAASSPLHLNTTPAPTLPASPPFHLRGERPGSPFRSVSPNPSLTGRERNTPPVLVEERLSAMQSKILALTLQQRTHGEQLDNIHEKLMGIEDLLKTLVAGQGLNQSTTFSPR
eukprot:TRINITY_DN20821_c0_g1_i1.p1 TRINITY_DN20821_c0_g1~~TRINITY_DN20821_c0_g1_i1.p1  ORF type:complete len:885 (+),score=242.55 TRINITY_DN20821_c0_g1_i1:55-2655(+)